MKNIWLMIRFSVIAIGLSGCVFASASQSPQSHFVFPNSNVIPLSESEGSTSKLCGLLIVQFAGPDADDQETATREALAKSNGDVLINVRTSTKMINFGVATICTTTVQGTAAKMEVGRQVLTGAPAPAATPAPTSGGCESDSDCKGNRVCRSGACVNP